MKLKEILSKYIDEGIHDKNTFKAIFLSGIPASGKTEFYNFSLRPKNFKSLDADNILAFLAKRDGIGLKEKGLYDKYSEQISQKLSNQNKLWTKESLGLAIDTTGQDLFKTMRIKSSLEEKGYKTAMVFVLMSVEDAIKYAEKRERAVDKEYIYSVNKKLQNNKRTYQNSFDFFIEVKGRDRDDYLRVDKEIDKWLND